MKMVDLPWAGNENEEFRRLLARSVSKIFDARDAGTDSAQGFNLAQNLDTAVSWLSGSQTVGLKSVNLVFMGQGEWMELRKEICNAVNRVLRGNGISHEDEVIALLQAASDAITGGSTSDEPVYVGDENSVSYFYSSDPSSFPAGILAFLDPQGLRAPVPGAQLTYEDGGSNFTGEDVVVTRIAKVNTLTQDNVDVVLPYTYLSGDRSFSAKEVGTNSFGSADGYVYASNIIQLNTFPSVPTLSAVTGGSGQLSFTITAGTRPGTRYRVSIAGAPGDGSAAERYEYTTDGTKTVTGLTAGTYPVRISRVSNSVGQILTDVFNGNATVT